MSGADFGVRMDAFSKVRMLYLFYLFSVTLTHSYLVNQTLLRTRGAIRERCARHECAKRCKLSI